MTAVLGALRDVFLHPPAAGAARRDAASGAATHVAPVDVAVLCGPGTADAAGAVVALAAMRRVRARCAVVSVWDPRALEPGERLATPTARRTAVRLRDRGILAAARGRLVEVALPAEPAEARQTAERLAAAVDVPLVTVLAGPRPEAFDAFLGARSRVIVAPPAAAPDGVAELAAVEAARHARATGVLDVPVGAGFKLAVRWGFCVPPSARAAADVALGHVS